ncbi:HAMP domain-containing protein [Crenobacter cavernae]|uniref:Methyl-accepting chemotaxis protein n=1 Tax=Crenobacter cavernae TaxID=2290923 RepID=A0A345Y5C8_9NEIS|nr:HAMP domain-containing protein [Crenobacter cavernae]AXK39130.1 methyl-accepting chemotaxis protein [Crenobacter cavernae]
MTLVKRLRLTAALTLACLIVVFGLTGWQLSALADRFSQYRERQHFSADLLALKAGALSLSRADPLLFETRSKLDRVNADVETLNLRVLAALQSEERAAFEGAVVKNWAGYRQQLESAIQIAETAPQDALIIPERAYQRYLAPLTDHLDKRLVEERRLLAAEEGAMRTMLGRLAAMVLGPLALASGLVLALQWQLGQRLRRQIGAMQAATERLARGDLTARLPDDGGDELADTARLLNDFLDILVDKLRSLRRSSGESTTGLRPPAAPATASREAETA